MGKTSKEITPDGYGPAAVEGLHFDINPRSGCFRFHRHYAYDIIPGKANYLYATAGFRPGTAHQAMQCYTTLCNGFTPFVLLAYYFTK